jgi:hypothetical protein
MSHGTPSGTGYISILPVHQGVEHSGDASFAPKSDYFDPDNLVRLAVEGGCNAVARKYAHGCPDEFVPWLPLFFNRHSAVPYKVASRAAPSPPCSGRPLEGSGTSEAGRSSRHGRSVERRRARPAVSRCACS